MLRTHTCGQLTDQDLNREVVLCGWVASRRDHGKIIFIDLRDRYGITQIVFFPKPTPQVYEQAKKLGSEYVIKVKGMVNERPQGTENPKIPTGFIEVLAQELELLNPASELAFTIDDDIEVGEETRLLHRYLDLRRKKMLEKLVLRHKFNQAARKYLDSQEFLEIETPFLTKSTPEGSRDYLVPSRLNPNKFYALPQSPQLFKQILMVSGMDKYYQVVRCFRDEDLRKDRQPEFTQLDIEMSFVQETDIMSLAENIIAFGFREVLGKEIKTPFLRIPYQEAMEKYGTDKPDLRFELKLNDVTDILQKSDFDIFKKAPVIKCINAEKCANFSRKELDELLEIAKTYKAKGLVTMKVMKDKIESNVAKYIDEKLQKELLKRANAKDGDLLLIVADNFNIVHCSLGAIRNELGKKLKLTDPKDFRFCWIVDFPLFAWNDEEQKWEAEHHIFTMPKKEHLQYLEKDPSKVHAQCYDMVLNGVELASGSIRIHRQDIQEKVMKVIGLEKKDAERKFGFLLEAFKYGAPPHGGFAPGIDRLVALMLGINDIREVIAFPKNKNAENPMDGCPTLPEEKTLKELHMKFDVKK